MSLQDLKIGFEFHAQIGTKQKLFCECPTDYRDAKPNEYTCEVCIGLPGNKPMPINRGAIDAALTVSQMMNCTIVSGKPIHVQRKHYDYPDLPNGYQKTSQPIAVDGEYLGVRIAEVHVEDDPGQFELSKGKVNYNRSSVPLVEIVTQPDIKSPEAAREFWLEMLLLLDYSGRFRNEPGGTRSDVNVSMGSERVEVKNVNSAAGSYHAILYEIKRQSKALRRGQRIIRETRAFLDDKMITTPLRTKETAADYRYIPDPDIPPLIITDDWIKEVLVSVPESPHSRYLRYTGEIKLNKELAKGLVSDRKLSDLYDQLVGDVDPRLAANWLVNDVRSEYSRRGLKFEVEKVGQARLKDLLILIQKKEVSPESGRLVFSKLFDDERPVRTILPEYSVADVGKDRIGTLVESIVERNREKISRLEEKDSLNFLMGEAIKELRGADPREVSNALREKIREMK